MRSFWRYLPAIALVATPQAGSQAAADPPLLPQYHLAGAAPQPPSILADPLDSPVAVYRVAKIPVEAAFLALSRSYGVPFILEPTLKGEVTLELRGGTLRDLLDALTQSQGYYWEREGRLIAVRRNVIRFYEIDYPQMTRSAQGTSNVVLSGQSMNNGLYGGVGIAGTSQAIAPSALANGANGVGNANQNDQTNISIQQQNQNTFWSDVQTELAGLAQTGETVAINKLAGIAIVTAPPHRQADFKALIELLNRRITQEVRISARVLEVDLNSEHQLGVDWALAATKIGGLTLSGIGTATNFTSVNGSALIPSTVSGTVSTGKVSAVVNALEEQGDVHAVSNPSVVSLNNQTAFVKVGTEQTFFSISNTTTINQTGSTVPYSTTQNSYQQNPITIGTVLYVTPEVNSDGTVTVDVLPAISQLIGIDTSPDGQQTAPRMTIKSLSTIARLHPDESIMIGGLIYNETDKQTQKVPLLGDLPWLGKVFQTSATVKSRSELVIFLTAQRLP